MRWIIAGLAALILSGCAAEQQMQHYVPPSVVAAVAAPTDSVLPGVPAAPEQTRIPIPTPLTSDKPPRGGAWKTMHANGYTGSLGEACALLGVTSEQCAAAAAAHERGQCEVMTVQNGTVLDGLTFTRGGQHRVQKHVLVALVNPPSWLMEVCSVGEGVYIVRFHGCNNFAVIRMKDKAPTPPPVATIPPAPQQTYCSWVYSLTKQDVYLRIRDRLGDKIRMIPSSALSNNPDPSKYEGKGYRVWDCLSEEEYLSHSNRGVSYCHEDGYARVSPELMQTTMKKRPLVLRIGSKKAWGLE